MLRSLTTITSFVLIVFAVAATPAAAADCVKFQGLKHCALGTATLTLGGQEGEPLKVDVADPNGGDGVAIDLGGAATSWSAVYNWRSEPGDSLVSTAIADGQAVSQSVVVETSRDFRIIASFTGSSSSSTYSAFVYRDGRLVGGVGGLTGVEPAILERLDYCDLYPDSRLCRWIEDFRNTSLGECEWAYRFGSDRGIQLPDGQRLVGDELRLLEELDPQGHYPYVSFDSMELTTSGDGLRIEAESVE